MKDRMRALAIPTLLALITSFNYGCTAAQRQELLMEAAEAGKKYLNEQLPKLKEAAIAEAKAMADSAAKKAIEVAEAKIKEQEAKHKATLDEQLKHYAVEDPDTGLMTAKTWKDFDVDKDDILDEPEIARITGFLMTQAAKKGELGTAGKGAGGALAALLAIALARRGVNKIVKKSSETLGPPSTPGTTQTAPPGA